ncbi:MAG: hypothetical protein ACP5I3_10735 [Thermoproteus sp.]
MAFLELLGLKIIASDCAERYVAETGGECVEASFPVLKLGGRKTDYALTHICWSSKTADLGIGPVRAFRLGLSLGAKLVPIEQLLVVGERLVPLEELKGKFLGYTLLDVRSGSAYISLRDGGVECRADVEADLGRLSSIYLMYVSEYARGRKLTLGGRNSNQPRKDPRTSLR